MAGHHPAVVELANGSVSDSPMVSDHGGCRPSSMLWNWDTIDTCLISEGWHIRSNGVFAASCIAVCLLTISLEFFRRLSKEYDKRMVREYQEGLEAVMASAVNSQSGSPSRDQKGSRERRQELDGLGIRIGESRDAETKERFRPSLKQQIIRGLLHTTQFVIAYFIMLVAMYYNGYILLSIFIGAFFGFVVFEWEWIEFTASSKKQEEATNCCG